VSITDSLNLDGASSVDRDINPSPALALSMNLLYQWKCAVTSTDAYGSSCDNMFTPSGATSSSAVVISNFQIWQTYSVTLTVSSVDGRTSSTSVAIYPTAPGTPIITINPAPAKVNFDSKIQVTGVIKVEYRFTVCCLPEVLQVCCGVKSYFNYGHIKSVYVTSPFCFNTCFQCSTHTHLTIMQQGYVSQLAYWSISGFDSALSGIAVTNTTATFSATQVGAGVSYPLLIAPRSLVPGKTYTFTLTGR